MSGFFCGSACVEQDDYFFLPFFLLLLFPLLFGVAAAGDMLTGTADACPVSGVLAASAAGSGRVTPDMRPRSSR